MWLSKVAIFVTVAWGLPVFDHASQGRSGTHEGSIRANPRTPSDATCDALAVAFKGSNVSSVFWPGSQNYTADNAHPNGAVDQISTCSTEPGTPEDVGTILKTIASMRAPFAVKSGGHSMNPGFASTPGVQISLARFADVVYDADAQTVRVGAGLLWAAVYTALAPYNVSVIGARNPGVGVGGLLLGGGYSYKTNQEGLGIDNIVSMETVLPNGTVTEVTAETHPDLWFALRGGGNNFGIVTNFVLKAYPQSAAWGGNFIYAEDQIQAVINATAKFAADTTDPKAQILVGFGTISGIPGLIATLGLYYDAPEQPAGVFDDLLAIPQLTGAAGTESLVTALGQDAPVQRGLFDSIPLVKYTAPILQAIVEEANRTSLALTAPANASFVGIACELFLPSILAHGPASAYPSQRHTALMPGNIAVIYTEPGADKLVHATIVAAGLSLRRTASALGQKEADPDSPDASVYPNYAAWGTPVERIYGQHLPRLREIKKKYDPEDIMGLAGGFKIRP